MTKREAAVWYVMKKALENADAALAERRVRKAEARDHIAAALDVVAWAENPKGYYKRARRTRAPLTVSHPQVI